MSSSSNPFQETSWEEVSSWYDTITSEEGHYYHQHVIIPNVLSLMDLDKQSSLLDLGCGQGILERALPFTISYIGLDLSSTLISQARTLCTHKEHLFYVADITKTYPIKIQNFTHAACILALQNIEDPFLVFQETFKHLAQGALFIIVMNHPCFRIPRQTSWGIDHSKKLQYRRLDAYMSPLKIPITTHPGKEKTSPVTWSFHYPLSTYLNLLYKAGFHTLGMEEWVSPKISTGKHAKMENHARNQFPLFLAIIAEKP